MTKIIGNAFNLDNSKSVLDFGCGIGRMSKGLIDEYGCSVMGVEISPDMQGLAKKYVNSSRFSLCFPEELAIKCAEGFCVDFAISLYVLHHTLTPGIEIERLRKTLRPGGKLLVLNNHLRCVPVSQGGWVNDGKSIRAMLRKQFAEVDQIRLPSDVFGEALVGRTFCNVYEKRS